MTGSMSAAVSGLARLARDHGLDLRNVILRVQTDLFVTAPVRDPYAVRSFGALASGLIPGADEETVATVARKLAPMPETPDEVLLLLVERGGPSRRAVLESAPNLSTALRRAAQAGAAGDVGPMLAARPDLTSSEISELVSRCDQKIDLALATNRRAELRGPALEVLTARGRERPTLARPLLDRDDLGPGDLAPLYLHAAVEQRDIIRAAIGPIASLRRPRGAGSGFDRRGCDRLVELAAAQDLGSFQLHLATMLNRPAPEWGFDRPDRRDLLALALVAVGMPEEDAVRIFLTLDPEMARSVSVVFRLTALVRTTSRQAAHHLLEAILGQPLRSRRGRHVPVLEPGAEAEREQVKHRREADRTAPKRLPQAS